MYVSPAEAAILARNADEVTADNSPRTRVDERPWRSRPLTTMKSGFSQDRTNQPVEPLIMTSVAENLILIGTERLPKAD